MDDGRKTGQDKKEIKMEIGKKRRSAKAEGRGARQKEGDERPSETERRQ